MHHKTRFLVILWIVNRGGVKHVRTFGTFGRLDLSYELRTLYFSNVWTFGTFSLNMIFLNFFDFAGSHSLKMDSANSTKPSTR